MFRTIHNATMEGEVFCFCFGVAVSIELNDGLIKYRIRVRNVVGKVIAEACIG